MFTSATWLIACGKLPSRRPAVGSYSSESSPTSFARRAGARRGARASSWRPMSARLSASQNEQGRNAPSPGRQPVDARRVGLVAAHEPVRASAHARSPRPCPATRGSSGRQEPDERDHQQARVELRSSRSTARTLPGSASKPSRADLGVDLVPERTQLVDRRVERRQVHRRRLHRPVERDPRHHLRVREVPARPAHLPDALVGLAPAVLEEVDDRLRRCPRTSGSSVAARACGSRCSVSSDLAVHVELELRRRGVADPHRRGALVAGQPVELELGEPPLAGRAVHDLQVARGRPPRRAAASPPGACLVSVAEPTAARTA